MSCTLHRTLLRRPWAVWLAVLIAVFSALAPTVSHALALTYRVAPMEASYCSSMGMVDAVPDSTGGQGSAAALVHCPFCLHVTDRLAPPPQPVVCPLRVVGRHPPPRVLPVPAYAVDFVLAAAPRGPPAFL
jgi:hypothetical protein